MITCHPPFGNPKIQVLISLYEFSHIIYIDWLDYKACFTVCYFCVSMIDLDVRFDHPCIHVQSILWIPIYVFKCMYLNLIIKNALLFVISVEHNWSWLKNWSSAYPLSIGTVNSCTNIQVNVSQPNYQECLLVTISLWAWLILTKNWSTLMFMFNWSCGFCIHVYVSQLDHKECTWIYSGAYTSDRSYEYPTNNCFCVCMIMLGLRISYSWLHVQLVLYLVLLLTSHTFTREF